MRVQLTEPIIGYVYRIYRTETGKSYVGSTIDIKKRRHSHFGMLRRGDHHCIHLQRAWDKYGEDAFAFEVLEELQIMSDGDLRMAENSHFRRFRLYNMCPVAESPLGVVHTDETKQKVSLAVRGRVFSEEHKARIGAAHKGRRHSDATRAHMSEVAKKRGQAHLREGWLRNRERIRELTRQQNQNRPPPSAETLRKRAVTMHGHPNGFLFMSPSGECVRVWNMAEFARERGLRACGLSAVVTGRQRSHHGWILVSEEEA